MVNWRRARFTQRELRYLPDRPVALYRPARLIIDLASQKMCSNLLDKPFPNDGSVADKQVYCLRKLVLENARIKWLMPHLVAGRDGCRIMLPFQREPR